MDNDIKVGSWIRTCYDLAPDAAKHGNFATRAESPMFCRPQQVRAVNDDGTVQCDLQEPGGPTYPVRKYIRADGPQKERFPRLCSDGKMLMRYMEYIHTRSGEQKIIDLAWEVIRRVEAAQPSGLGT